MKELKHKLDKQYHNSDELYELLIYYKLENIIKNAINNLDSKMVDNQIQDLPRLSGMILNDINNVISTIDNKDHKLKIEYLLSDIFQDYLSIILSQDNSEIIIKEIIESLKTACEYRGYNYLSLSKILGLEKNILLKTKKIRKDIYYQWLAKDYELDGISRDLYDKKLIFSIKEFKKLFKLTSETFYVRFYVENKDDIIVLFSVLKKLNLIKPIGISGYFSPLVQCAVDKENNFLIKKAINKEHERIKRNAIKYNIIKDRMIKIVKDNLSK